MVISDTQKQSRSTSDHPKSLNIINNRHFHEHNPGKWMNMLDMFMHFPGPSEFNGHLMVT